MPSSPSLTTPTQVSPINRGICLLPSAGAPSFLRHSIVKQPLRGTGLATCCPSATPLGLTLGPALPWADQPSPGTLGLPVSVILTHFALLMPAFSLPCCPPNLAGSTSPHMAPLPIRTCIQSPSFGAMLSPRYFRRNNPRPVSYYALFKGWLLLSQPPGCPGIVTSLPHSACLWDLSCGSGLFPSRPRNFSPAVSLLNS